MKRILTTTDFSSPANNAVQFAAALANEAKADLSVLNSFHVPVVVGGDMPLTISMDDLQKDANNILDEMKSKIHTQYPGMNIHIHATAGFAVEEIRNYAGNHNADLIVMGITGTGTKMGEILIGSTSVSVINSSPKPIMVVPIEAKFRKIKKIALAEDFKEELSENNLKTLSDLVNMFNAELKVINIVKPEGVLDNTQTAKGIKIENQLKGFKHSIHIQEDSNIENGIENFINGNEIDLLVMIRRKHPFFERMFSSSNTRKMAFHTHIPLLVLH